MAATLQEPAVIRQPPARARTISLFTAANIVLSSMVGMGIFTSLGYQVGALPSGFVIMTLWFLGGICALCGGLAYAELAAALPRSGGEYHFLSEIFHPAVGFMAGWISATVGFAAPIAAAAMTFGEYGHHAQPSISSLALSLAIVWICSAVHFSGTRRGSAFQNVFTVLKVLTILAFIVAGLFSHEVQPISFLPAIGDGKLICGSAFAVSLVYVMYAYTGWNASTYIVSEIRDPQRNVLRSVLIATLAVVGLYLGANAIFLHTTPMSDMAQAAAANKPNVASLAAAHIFGQTGGRAMDAFICLSLISHISSMIWIGPRVSVAIGEDMPALHVLAKRTRSGIPRVALVVQLLIVNVIIFTATFESIVVEMGLVLTLCSFLTVLGVIVLRIRRPNLPRPYKTWGYPITPIIFLAVSFWMMIHILRSNPRESLVGLGVALIGLAVYFGFHHTSPTLSKKSAST